MAKIKANDIEINYELYGEGEPLVLIMGLGLDMQGWLPQIPAFSKEYQVLTFDNRGVGKSEKPDELYKTETMAEDTAGLMGVLNIKKIYSLLKNFSWIMRLL